MTETKVKAQSVEELKSELAQLEGGEESVEEEDAPDPHAFRAIRDEAGGISVDFVSTPDSEYYTKYDGSKDEKDALVNAEEAYSAAILEYFRARRNVAEKCDRLQFLYNEAGIDIDVAEVVVGRS